MVVVGAWYLERPWKRSKNEPGRFARHGETILKVASCDCVGCFRLDLPSLPANLRKKSGVEEVPGPKSHRFEDIIASKRHTVLSASFAVIIVGSDMLFPPD